MCKVSDRLTSSMLGYGWWDQKNWGYVGESLRSMAGLDILIDPGEQGGITFN